MLVNKEELYSDQRVSEGSVSNADPTTPTLIKAPLDKIEDVEERSDSSESQF